MFLRTLFLFACSLAAAAEPPGYYSRAEGLSGGPLKAALHEVVKGHTVIPYAQLHAPLARLHEDPANPANVILLYSADSAPKGTDFISAAWNREHAWPRSRGNTDQQGADDSDLHYIWPCYDAVNSTRGNLYFDVSDRADPGFRSPGHALAPRTTMDSDSWEPPAGQRGALARCIFYVAVRYDGEEPFTSDMELVSYAPSGARFGNVNTLLRWHAEEPVTDAERRRNDLIFSDYQRNRNPFIDHPEWVALIWGEPLAGASGSRPIAQVEAIQGSASEQPQYAGEFQVSLSQAAPAGGLRLEARLTGSSAAAIDFALSGPGVSYQNGIPGATLAVPAGATAVNVRLLPFSDGLGESPETATLVLEPGPGYVVVPNTSRAATITITDLPVLPAIWRFDAGAPFANPLPAEAGNAVMNFADWRGTVTSFSGVSGNALSVVGSEGNGSFLQLSFSMAGYRDLMVSFQTRGTSSGFTSGTWAWSTDGTTFTTVPGVNTASTGSEFSSRTVDLTGITALNNAPAVTLRYTLAGATSTSGNNRIDNLTINAQPLAGAADAVAQIVSQTSDTTGAAGTHFSLFVNAVGRPAPTYQWYKDGSAINGATGATLSIPFASMGDVGTYHATVTNRLGSATSQPMPVTLAPSVSRLINVATRATVGPGEAALIAGFVIGGTEARPVLIRGAGPGLAQFGVTGALADPLLEVFHGQTRIAANDDWPAGDAAAHSGAGAFAFAAGSQDAALVTTLPPGAYTVQISPATKSPATSGVGLVEVFELGAQTAPTTPNRLVNLSTRAFVGAGQDILIPGVVVGPPAVSGVNSTRLVLVRAVGPGLRDFGVSGTLARPRVTVLDRNGAVAGENIGWQSTRHPDALVAATGRVGAFPLNATRADSALLLALSPLPYTIQVSGADGGTGVALVEVYEVP